MCDGNALALCNGLFQPATTLHDPPIATSSGLRILGIVHHTWLAEIILARSAAKCLVGECWC